MGSNQYLSTLRTTLKYLHILLVYMPLPLPELLVKSWDDMTEYEAEVALAQYEAISIRREIERNGIELVFGTGRVSFYPSKLEIDSLGLGLIAYSTALGYVTQEEPLTVPQYIELQKYAIEQLPRAVWDHGSWFKQFNKVVNEQGISVDAGVEAYMVQNERLAFEYLLGGALQAGTKRSQDKIMADMSRYQSRRLEIAEDGTITIGTNEPLPPDADARQIYELLRGTNVNVDVH
jgi:hypothetical protein